MNSIIQRRGLLYVTIVCLLTVTGCAYLPVNLHNMAVEVMEAIERGEWYVVEKVRHGDTFRATASFVWSEPGSAGNHRVRWEVYQDGQLIRHGQEDTYSFQSSPFKVWLTLDSTALKQGNCEIILYLDGEECGRMSTKIVKPSSKP